ncbi:Zn(II)2Cys6 transcription factor [Aspergillus luchuensis]|uniref:Zn(II)2Cys6 transcription factor n=1 Tax=Aspergillus kawachii TaxID=1069201 RepID=A0A146FHB5_ASPKA|nr:Zn(II)2Cys6 transcription factor [Aspergillus luchuensis]
MTASHTTISTTRDRKRREQKPRVLLSCTSCREKKLRCSRERPCTNCRKRGQDAACQYNTERSNARTSGKPEPTDVHNELQYLKERLLFLERQVTRDCNSSSTSRDDRLHVGESPSRDSSESEIALAASQVSAGGSPLTVCFLTGESGTRFVNPSHWQAIMNDAKLNQKDYNNNDGEDTNRISRPEGPVLLLGISQMMDMAELLNALPPRETADMLVDRCLNSREPSLSFQQYRRFWDNPAGAPVAWIALLYSTLSCGIYIQHTGDPKVSSLDLPRAFYVYRNNGAVALAKSNFATPGLYKVEASILYLGIEYLQSNDYKIGLPMLLSIVSRLAIMMGYHRDPQLYHLQISSFEAEMRRRAWLVLITIDSVLAWHTGLPRVISQSLGDVRRPMNLLDSDFGPETTVLPPSRPADEVASNIVYMSAMEQMLSVANEVGDMASHPSLLPERTLELNMKLENTKSRLPSILQLQSPETRASDDETVIKQYCLEITYQRARCILHRHYLTALYPELHKGLRSVCVDAAQQVLTLYSELFQVLAKTHNQQLAWFGASRSNSDCLTAAMVISLEVITQSKNGRTVGITPQADLIELLKASQISWRSSPRPTSETLKAAGIIGTMLDLLGYGGVGPSLASYGAQEGQQNNRESTETFLRSPSMMHDILTGDSALELFDWVRCTAPSHLLR